jgi:hypothetical protein
MKPTLEDVAGGILIFLIIGVPCIIFLDAWIPKHGTQEVAVLKKVVVPKDNIEFKIEVGGELKTVYSWSRSRCVYFFEHRGRVQRVVAPDHYIRNRITVSYKISKIWGAYEYRLVIK